MQATIFNIQRFSIHDGPGVRTTVFLKGCPADFLKEKAAIVGTFEFQKLMIKSNCSSSCRRQSAWLVN